MRAFKDAEGREWLLELNVDNLREIHARTEVDLTQLFADETVASSLERTFVMADILWVLCEPQRTIDKAEFDRGLKGDAVEAAEKTLMEALIDFFPSKQREILRAAMEVPDAAQAEMQKELDKTLTRLKEKGEIRSTSGSESTSTQASSESIPVGSP